MELSTYTYQCPAWLNAWNLFFPPGPPKLNLIVGSVKGNWERGDCGISVTVATKGGADAQFDLPNDTPAGTASDQVGVLMMDGYVKGLYNYTSGKHAIFPAKLNTIGVGMWLGCFTVLSGILIDQLLLHSLTGLYRTERPGPLMVAISLCALCSVTYGAITQRRRERELFRDWERKFMDAMRLHTAA